MKTKINANTLAKPPATSDGFKLTRRSALKGTAVLLGSIKASSMLAVFAPSRTYAVELQVLDEAASQTLLSMIKTAFPQKKFGDEIFHLSVKDFDNKMQNSEENKQMLEEGLSTMQQAGFTDLNDEEKLQYLKDIEGTPYFQFVRSQCVVSLYSNPLAYEALGYEGESFSKGGYLYRGVQDLKWLPDPPPEASPPAPST